MFYRHFLWFVALLLLAIHLIFTIGCGTGPVASSAAQNLSSITIKPAALSVTTGSTQQLTATGNYSDNTQSDLTAAVSWTTSNAKVATIGSDGILSSLDAGSATVTAAYRSLSATASVAVNSTGTNVLTWHYDNQRTGLNPSETILTTANVNAGKFGKLFSYLVDGYLYAQPLYVSGLTIAGASRNVVFVATEKASVYAFDADTYGNGSPLWQVSLLQSGEVPQSGSIKPYQGITSTPAIDLSSNAMYVVSAQKSASGASYRLHALDLTTGAEKFGGPVVLDASVPGTNSDSVNGVLSLPSSCVQRAALLLANNSVYIGFGSCHSGWLLSYDAQSLSQTGVFSASPDANGYGTYGGAGGVWMGGGGPAADSNGSIYITTGNGPYDGVTSFGDSILRFNPQLKLLDHFTPDDWAFLQCADTDMASGGLLLLPAADAEYALAGGKLGKLYLVSTSDLGGMKANNAGAAQTLWFEQGIVSPYSSTCTTNTGAILTDEINSYQIFGTAAFFNNSVYLGITPSQTSIPGPMRQFTFADGQLTPASATSDSIPPGSYGTTPFVSANGTSNGIVWMVDHGAAIQGSGVTTPSPAILRAYDATNLAKELYTSSQNASDTAGFGIKFTSPIVANGKVFVGTGHDPDTAANPQGELDIYGLK